jgi:hypothetical protein
MFISMWIILKLSIIYLKGVINIRKSKKYRQYNGQNKKNKQWSTKHYTEN